MGLRGVKGGRYRGLRWAGQGNWNGGVREGGRSGRNSGREELRWGGDDFRFQY